MAGEFSRNDIVTIIEDAMEKYGIGVCILGSDGTPAFVNKACLRLFDCEESAQISEGIMTGISPELGEILAAARKGKDVQGSKISVNMRSGVIRRLAIFVYATQKTPGGEKYSVIVTHDISGYINEGGEEEWHDIVDGLEDGFYECDTRGYFVSVSRAMCHITEYDHNEIIGMSYKKLYKSEDYKKIYDIYHEVFITGKPNRFVNFQAFTKNGRKMLIECSISPVRGPGGDIKGFRGIIRDISDKNHMEKQLQRARKLEAIGILSGGIAHDYNNALTAILGNISLAKMEADPENKSLMEVLNDAEEASVKAVELTRRLSTFARGGKPERKIINYAESLKNTVDSVMYHYGGAYTLTIQDGLWETDIDEFQIGQVVTYILDNAKESMPEPGSITITAENVVVEKEMSHLEITLQPGKYVRISISDEGAGIPPENLESIYDPYYTTKEMSSGMGLATSYAIIKRHHGYIDVKSAMGKGSVFYVYLPAVREQAHG
jgi:two-component system, cell cycle sensor histidine kinase and response regulator CckA